MKTSLFILVLIAFLALISCAQNTSTTLTDQPAYLKFIGDPANITFQLNEQPEIILNPENEKNLLYEFPEGTHILSIFRNGELIYKKNILMEKGKTTEVLLP